MCSDCPAANIGQTDRRLETGVNRGLQEIFGQTSLIRLLIHRTLGVFSLALPAFAFYTHPIKKDDQVSFHDDSSVSVVSNIEILVHEIYALKCFG